MTQTQLWYTCIHVLMCTLYVCILLHIHVYGVELELIPREWCTTHVQGRLMKLSFYLPGERSTQFSVQWKPTLVLKLQVDDFFKFSGMEMIFPSL